MRQSPEVDPTTSGITFVDILFALAIGLVLMRVPSWAENHGAHSLPAAAMLSLVATLSLILTSFVGYHNSENRPRFNIRFVNASFVKFFIDIALVICYFVFAAYAPVTPPQTQTLVLLWLTDFAGWYEKSDWRTEYKVAWNDALASDKRPDVYKEWTGIRFPRIAPTVCGFIVAGIVYWALVFRPTPLPRYDSIRVDVIIIVQLFLYRIWKDWIK